jgi:hypothetical protein
VLLYGEAADRLAEAVDDAGRIVRCADLDDASAVAGRLARRGDTVLFSPGCESDIVLPPGPGARFREAAGPRPRRRAEAA